MQKAELAFAPYPYLPCPGKIGFCPGEIQFCPGHNWAKRFNGQIAIELLYDIEKV